jgi:hypothetical protein
MSIVSLSKTVAPPTNPRETGTEDGWASVESQLGTALPDDYKEYVRVFGSGTFDDFIVPLNPFSVNKHLNLLSGVEGQREAERVMRLNWPKEAKSIVYPFDVYPAKDGLLVWGTTTNAGVFLYWYTQGFPNNWPVVVCNLRDGEHETIGVNMTGFLAAILSGSIGTRLFPEDFPGADKPQFIPAKDRK